MNVVLINSHWNNRGDEAAHRALWKELGNLYPGARFTILIKDKKSVECFPDLEGFTAIPGQFNVDPAEIWLAVTSRGKNCADPVLKRSIDVLKDADLIIYPPGGSVINDRFFWSKQMEYLMPFLCASVYGIKMAVCSPSMGPFDDGSPHELRQWLLRAPDALCVREDISRKYLEEIGITENVTVTMDLAFMDDVNEEAERRKLEAYRELRDFLGAHEKVVGITISDFRWHVKLGRDPELSARIEEAFRGFIAWLGEQGIGVLLIPQLFGNQNDVDDLRRYTGSNVLVMDEDPDTYFQQYVIGQLFAVIGMRYHSNIFAAKMGTPFIAIPYEEKMQGFLELAGLIDHMLALDEVSDENLRKKFTALSDLHSKVCSRLREQREDWRARARRTVEALENIEI